MSQNTPFVFGGGGGQPPPSFSQSSSHEQQQVQSQAPTTPSTAQHMAFSHNMQLPGMDMGVLQGITPEQLAAIGRLFQTGALSVPPPAGQHLGRASATSTPATENRGPLQRFADRDDASVEEEGKEEGEVEEGEEGEEGELEDLPQERAFLRPPPTGPRNGSITPRGRLPSKVSQNQLNNKSGGRSTIAQQTPQRTPNGTTTRSERRPNADAAKLFVREMVKAGYTFEDLAQAVSDSRPLIPLFKELGLSTTVKTSQPADIASVPMAKPSNEESRKVPVAKKAVPTKPVDRSEYLARLQAVRSKKSDPEVAPAATPSVVTQHVSESIVTQEPATAQQIHVEKGNEPPPSSPTTIEKKTQLIREKLEALRAQQAAKKMGTVIAAKSSPISQPPTGLPVARQTVSSPAQSVSGATKDDIAARFAGLRSQPPSVDPVSTTNDTVATTAAVTALPPAPSPMTAFRGLPGLFMNQPLATSHAVQHSMSPSASQAQHGTTAFVNTPTTVSRKRAVAADFDDTFAKPNPPKRPFGQSRNASEDESVVIHVSDDEDGDEDDMDLDDTADTIATDGIPTKSFRDVGPLRDFPPRPNFQTSTPGTPGGSTPGGVVYQQRMREIEEMKRKIAEREARNKANGRSFGAVTDDSGMATAPPSSTALPAVGSSIATSKQDTPPRIAGAPIVPGPVISQTTIAPDDALDASIHPTTSVSRPASASIAARKQERERDLQQRLSQLEQDESEDLDEAVSAATDRSVHMSEPLRSISGALPGIFNSDTTTRSYATASPGAQNEAPEDPDIPAAQFDDGEISDDSMSRFYDGDDSNTAKAPNIKTGSEMPLARAEATFDDALEAQATDSAVPHTNGSEVPKDVPQEAFIVKNTYAEINDTVGGQDPVNLGKNIKDESHVPSPTMTESKPSINLRQPQHQSESDEDSSSEASEDRDDSETEHNPASGLLTGPEGKMSVAEAALPDADATEQRIKVDTPDDDVAIELQPSDYNQSTLPEQKKSSQPKSHYTPYESPLRGFKDYRWHSKYAETVPGGYRSLTYSHNIDPDMPLCPNEATGSQCNYADCPNQHFKDMGLADNDLLQTMGTRNLPTQSIEDEKRWRAGLAAVVREIRSSGSPMDVDSVAKRIAQYRTDFLSDHTKVINFR